MFQENKHLVLLIFQIVMSYLNKFDNSQNLTIVGLVPSLCKNHFPRKEDYSMLLAYIGLDDHPIGTSFWSQLT